MNPFELSEEEKTSATGKEQAAMIDRLVEFVNALQAEVEALKTPETQNPS